MHSPNTTTRKPPTRRGGVRLLLAAGLLLTLTTPPLALGAGTRSNFDHLTTGFELLGQHRNLPCEACHANAIFKGTPTACGACHGIGTAVRATAKPATHILSTDQCQSCHTPWAWNPAVNFDHTQALGSCSTCHNGVQAQGKPPTHIVTDLECDTCHTTLSWGGAMFNHAGVTSGCAACHDNVHATGVTPTHIPIGTPVTPCESCHSPTNYATWKPGVINHPAVATLTCASCHETANFQGMIPSTNTTAADSRPNTTLDPKHPASGDCGGCHTTASFAASVSRPANHIPTTGQCIQCHTTGNDAQYDVVATHQGVTGCLSCHGPSVANTFANITIVTTPANHMPIGSLDCNGSGCHTTANVNPGGFVIGPASTSSPTLTVAGHATVASAVPACSSCHETAPYVGMIAGTAGAWGDSRPTAYDSLHPTAGDCGQCHTTTPTFVTDVTAGKPSNHIPTNAPCVQCHTTPNNYGLYSSTGTHQGVSGCLACHGPTVAATFNLTNPVFSIVTTPGTHIAFGTADCNGSGCHSTANVAPGGGGFKIGAANISSPTLTVAGHATIAAAGVLGCVSCHETAPNLGMVASTNSTVGDSRPNATLDANHQTPPKNTGECGNCHVTAPTFAANLLPSAPKPANHMPTSAPCAQCHTTIGNFAVYDVTGVHQGVTGCLACHGPSTGPFAGPPPGNTITIVGWPGSSHFPIGTSDCNASGCHSTSNVQPGGFKVGTASISSPTLTVTGHSTIASAGVAGCQTCHETAPYTGMMVSTATTAGDSRPTALDKSHPTTGDCNGCHTTTPTFASDQTGNAKPANHIPTTAACAQCHTTPGNNAVYSVTGTHQGVTACLTCHGPTVATTFANITIVTTPGNHMPIGSLDCNGSGCHTTTNVNPGGFLIGTANLTTPTLTVAGHTTVGTAVSGCQTCHETAPYIGMLASTATAAGDSRPMAFDKNHPTTGDCTGCHTTTPTFTSNVTSGSKPTNHIPTNAACTQCHTTAGNYAAYVMGTTGHAGITNNCAQCHAYGLSFYNMAPPTLKEPASGATGHIPAVPPNGTTVIACELCHSPSAFTTFSGTVMKHAYVVAMKCDACHEYGMTWQVNSGAQLWTRPSPNHKPGKDCGGSGCHTARDKRMVRQPARTPTTTASTKPTATTAKPATPAAAAPSPALARLRSGAAPLVGAAAAPAAAAPFSHTSVAATACVSCHNGTAATGKPSGHIATTNNCQSCHMTLAWLPVSAVDHSQVIGSCVGCHNGAVATGKPSSHIATTAGCERCHTTNAWTPARFDHASVAPHTCTSCHNGVRANGLARTHIPTTQQCDACHGTLAWTPALVDHSGLLGNCAGCHNGVAAIGLSPGHLLTHLDCSSCHSYPLWSAVRFVHAAAAYPGNHVPALACAACHSSNSEKVPYPAAAYAGTCAGCHAREYVAAKHPKIAGGRVSYGVGELANCSGACHVYSDATLTTIARSQPGPKHRVVDGKF
jgi:hypothetical protein